jgi:hypothetical protein
MSKKMKLTLYHSKQCIHCVSFLPQWLKFEDTFNSKYPRKLEIRNIEAAMIGSDVTIAGQQLEGYPTVKVEFDNKEFEYKGKRTYEGLSEFVTQRIML